MSRSETYRPAYLTAEQREEIARRARAERFRTDLLPALRAHGRERAARLEAHGSLTTGERQTAEHRLERATTLEELRTVVVGLADARAKDGRTHHLGASGGSAASSGLRELTPDDPVPPADAIRPEAPFEDDAALAFERAHLAAELASLRRTAAGLGVDAPVLRPAEDAIEALDRAVRSGERSDAQAAIDRAARAIAALDEVIDVHLLSVERGDRARASVIAVLEQMGFGVQEIATDGATTIVFGVTGDGRAAEIELADETGATSCHARFTDEGHAVPPEDPDAGSVCEPAVLDAFEFHRRFAGTTGLALGPVEATGAPRRGAPAASPRPQRRRPVPRPTTRSHP